MKKEVLIAVFIGCLLGLIVTFGIHRANEALKSNNSEETTQVATETSFRDTDNPPATTADTKNKTLLTISTPENNALVNIEKIKVSGKTDANITVVISYTDGEKVTTSDNSGNFSEEISLTGGSNQIDVFSFNNNGEQTTKSLNVVYSTAEI